MGMKVWGRQYSVGTKGDRRSKGEKDACGEEDEGVGRRGKCGQEGTARRGGDCITRPTYRILTYN